MTLTFLTPTPAYRGQQQYYYKGTKQYLAQLLPSQEGGCQGKQWEEGESGISSTKWRTRPVHTDRVYHKYLSTCLLMVMVNKEESSRKAAVICRGGLIWFIELVNLRKSELWAVLHKPLQVKKEAVVIDARNLLSWGEKCLCISM